MTIPGNQGGALVLVGSSAKDTLVYRAATNHGISFETKASHLHAVTTVSGSAMLMLVVQYSRAASS